MKHTYLGLIIIGLLAGLFIAGDSTKNDKRELLSGLPKIEAGQEIVYAQEPEVDIAIPKIQGFLDEYGAPKDFDAVVLVGAARRNGLRPDLLVLIGCVESSCGRNYRYNRFGWGSDTKKFDFGDLDQEARKIAGRIASMEHYEKWVESDQSDLVWFAKLYNNPEWKSYSSKLKYFEEMIENK